MLDQWRRFTPLEEANESVIIQCVSLTRASKYTCMRCVTIRQALPSLLTFACAWERKRADVELKDTMAGLSFELEAMCSDHSSALVQNCFLSQEEGGDCTI